MQQSLFPVRLAHEDAACGTRDLRCIGTDHAGRRYALRTLDDPQPLAPLTEWLCYHLCQRCGIYQPGFAVVERVDGSPAFGSLWVEDAWQYNPAAHTRLGLEAWMRQCAADISAHQIVERYQLAGKMVTAEFALRNGRLHVLETVDLRTSNPAAKRTDVRAKALVMDYAADTEPDSARYAIIAGADSPLAADTRKLLQRYATHVLAWESRTDMEELMHTLAEAIGKPDILPPQVPV